MAAVPLPLDRGVRPLALTSDERPVHRHRLPTRLIVTAFILFHVLAIFLWLVPASPASAGARTVTRAYISWGGLWQSWGMFAPNPSRLNLYISAEITYRDGTQRAWSFPRMNKLDLFSRYYEERYRKFEEYAHLDNFDGLWPDMATWIARNNNPDPSNPPVRVELIRNWWIVPPPPANGDISRDPPHNWSHYTFFRTAIRPEELR